MATGYALGQFTVDAALAAGRQLGHAFGRAPIRGAPSPVVSLA